MIFAMSDCAVKVLESLGHVFMYRFGLGLEATVMERDLMALEPGVLQSLRVRRESKCGEVLLVLRPGPILYSFLGVFLLICAGVGGEAETEDFLFQNKGFIILNGICLLIKRN